MLIAVGLFARDLLLVRAALEDTRASLEEVAGALGEVDIAAAEAALENADQHLGVARSRSGGPLWNLVAAAPVVGDNVEVVRAVVGVGTSGLDLAQDAVQDGQNLLAGGLDVRVSDGQLDLQPLLDARDLVAGLPLDGIITARERLAAVDPAWQPRQIRDGKAESLHFADDAIETIEAARDLLDAMPGFLGTDGPRRYFLGVQTPAELRGTGGLIGYWVVLQIDEGRFSLSESGVYEALADIEGQPQDEPEAAVAVTSRVTDLIGDPWDGVPTTPEFRDRYAHTAAPGFFSNVNVDPDLPTTARVALDLFAHRTGEQLDGMLLLDPIAMQLILEAVGQPIPTPAEIDDPALPAELPPSSFARYVLVDIYEDFGQNRSDVRRPLLRGLGDLAFERVFDGAWDGVAMSVALRQAAATRHLQVFSELPEEQAAFSRVGITGELAHDAGDLLAVTANNAVGGKQDVHLGHEVTAEIALSRPRLQGDERVVVDRASTIRVTLDNPLPSQGMDTYIIGNCPIDDERHRCFEGPPGWNRTWFSVWTPGGDALQAAQDADGMAAIRADSFRGMRVIDHYVETPPESRAWFELAFDGEVEVERDRDGLLYELTWVRQSKAIPDLLDIAIAPPAGWRAVDVRVTGGGDGIGMGVHGEGVLLEAGTTRDGTATITGTVDASTTVQVRLERHDE